MTVAMESLRQGDVVAVQLGDADTDGSATPVAGHLIAAGSRGEHRLHAESLVAVPPADWPATPDGHGQWVGIFDLRGARLHHTNPSEPHGEIEFTDGRWGFLRQHELTADAVIVEVSD